MLGALIAGAAALPGPRATAADSCWFSGDRAKLAKRLSPLDSAVATLGDAEIKVCYGRPSARGRTMLGGLLPWKQEWRFGANEATTIHLPVAVKFGTVPLGKGVYSLYASPDSTSLRIVVNDKAERWGIPIDRPLITHDVGSVTVPTEPTDSLVETLTMRLDPAPDGTVTFVFEWEHTRARVKIERTK
jgi:hypothetical protein